ncbi:MAG: 50S ribosomal protein L24, partial [Candidatus Bathyarchaeia archaeon]
MQTLKTTAKPSKQRKMLFKAPAHIRYKFFASPLSPELEKSHKIKSLPVRTGDTVRILRGDHKGLEGKIT